MISVSTCLYNEKRKAEPNWSLNGNIVCIYIYITNITIYMKLKREKGTELKAKQHFLIKTGEMLRVPFFFRIHPWEVMGEGGENLTFQL